VTAWQSDDNVSVFYGGKEARDIQLVAASERYFEIKNLRIAIGRPFTAQENRSGVPAAVLGDAVAKRLFVDRTPLERLLRIGAMVLVNIVLLSAADRGREIGLRKSIGAPRRDVPRQLLAESAALATVGAAFGIVAGIGLTLLINAVSPLPASVSPASVV